MKPTLCRCGCGRPAPIATKNEPSKGYVKGQPRTWIRGHSSRFMPKQTFITPDRYTVEDRGYDTPCWIWNGFSSSWNGYSRVAVNGRKTPAHRAIYEQEVGPVPEGLVLDHLCRVPLCVNPAHLEPVTHAENVRRGKKGALYEPLTHCPNGHEYTPENTLPANKYGRRCRACYQENYTRHNALKKLSRQ